MFRGPLNRFVAATFVVAVVVYAIARAEGDRPATGPTTPAAEKPAGATAAIAPDAVERALEMPIDLKFDETPLKDVAEAIAAKIGVNVVLDSKALTDAGVAPETPLTFDAGRAVSLQSALRLMLAPHEMNFIVDSENVLLLTSETKAKEHVVLRVYEVRDLLTTSHKIAAVDPDFDGLIEAITPIIAPTTWTDSGGTGTIAPYGLQLVVSQTREIHEQIAELLKSLRGARDDPQKYIAGGGRIAPPADSLEGKILAALGTVQDFDFQATPLKDVVEVLHKRGLPAQLDAKALTDAGVTDDTSFTFRIKHTRLDNALRLMLQEHECNFLIDHEVVLITSTSRSKEAVVTRVYPIGDFLAASPVRSEDETEEGNDALITLITTSVSPTTWTDAGGTGSIAPFPKCKVLVVSQTPEVQEQVARLLAKLRAGRRGPASATDKPADPTAMVTQFYRLAPEHSNSADEYLEVVRHLVEPKIWTGGEAYLGKVPGAIVAHCLPATQEEIHDLLVDLEALSRPVGQQPPLSSPSIPVVGFEEGAFSHWAESCQSTVKYEAQAFLYVAQAFTPGTRRPDKIIFSTFQGAYLPGRL